MGHALDHLLDIVLRAMFVENLALVFLLGMCTYIAVSKRVETAVGLGIAVVVVQVITVPVNNLLHVHLLAPGALAWLGLPQLDLSFLALVTFIGVIAALVQILELVLERYVPVLHARLGIYLPLLTVNCAILGASLLMVQRRYDFTESVAWGFGTGAGWALAIILFAALRERLRYSDVPKGLQGLGLAFVVTGFLAFGLAGFTGVVL
ncbi:MAG TPA: NADH:ubiquinone reductase (Na(+)-transporting) subunit E [Pseudomonadales bacterium]|nr:NADH:ubiquinone reductase (Na(+)-transporting) subunit E [Pseudomonadales bacterium]